MPGCVVMSLLGQGIPAYPSKKRTSCVPPQNSEEPFCRRGVQNAHRALFLHIRPYLGIVSRFADGNIPFLAIREFGPCGRIAVHSPELSPSELAGPGGGTMTVHIKNIHPVIVLCVCSLEAAVFRIHRRIRTRAAFPNGIQPRGIAAKGVGIVAAWAGIAIAIAGVV